MYLWLHAHAYFRHYIDMSIKSVYLMSAQDQCSEVGDQRSLCLELFSQVEECRRRSTLNTDPKYLHLLKTCALDPGSAEKLKNLQLQYQVSGGSGCPRLYVWQFGTWCTISTSRLNYLTLFKKTKSFCIKKIDDHAQKRCVYLTK